MRKVNLLCCLITLIIFISACSDTEALHEAVKKNSISEINSLIEKGVDINAKNQNNATPVDVALCNGYYEVAKLLIEKGAKVDEAAVFNGQTVLQRVICIATSPNYEETAIFMIKKGYSINVKDDLGKTSLHYAAEIRFTEISRLLIEKGVDVNAKDNAGNTPLHNAATNNCIEIAKLLIEKGADINAVSQSGNSPLNNAIKRNHTEMIKLLESKNAKINNAASSNQKSDEIKPTGYWHKSAGETDGYDWLGMNLSQKHDIIKGIMYDLKNQGSKFSVDEYWFIEQLDQFYGSNATNTTKLNFAFSMIGVGGNKITK